MSSCENTASAFGVVVVPGNASVSGRVLSSDRTWSAKLLADLPAPFDFQFGNLVADSPDHDGWMIAIAQHHRRDILLPPFIKVAAVIELDLVRLPRIERLIQNQQAEPIACIEKRG